MRILYDHGAGNRPRVMNRLLQFLLGNVLNILIDSQNEIFARLRLLLDVGEPLSPRIHRDGHFSGAPAQFIVERVLDAALPRVLHPYGSYLLSGKIPRRIKPLWLFLEMNAL